MAEEDVQEKVETRNSVRSFDSRIFTHSALGPRGRVDSDQQLERQLGKQILSTGHLLGDAAVGAGGVDHFEGEAVLISKNQPHGVHGVGAIGF